MADTVKLKRSAVAGKIPTTADLDLGELGINTYDGKVFLKQDNGTPTIKELGAVSSVNGYTGTVALGKADVGLGNVDSTSDLNKPVSTATQTALNLKANLASPALTGTPTAPTATAGTSTTQIATTAFVADAVSTADEWTRTGTTLAPKTAGDVVSVSAGTAALPGLTPVGDPNTGLLAPAADTLAISTGGTEKLRIDSSGRLLLGTSSALSAPDYSGTSRSPKRQLAGTTYEQTLDLNAFFNATAGNGGATYQFTRSNTNTIGGHALVADGNDLGFIQWAGSDGTAYIRAAQIYAEVEGTPGLNDMPGRLVFSTTADGASSPTERLRLTSAGRMGLATSAPAATAHIAGSTIIGNVDVANASYDGVSFSVAAREISPVGLFFSPNGKQMFTIGNAGDTIDQYTLSTAWNISTASYVTEKSIAAQDGASQDLYIRSDGTKLYIIASTTGTVYQYTLTNPWDITTLTYDSISFSVALNDATPTGLFFKPDGLSMYVTGTTSDTVYRYNLSTAWDASTAALDSSFSVASLETLPHAVTFAGDGSRMFVMGSTGDDVNIFNLTTPWDITTATYVTVFSVAAQDASPSGLFVKPDGTKMYMVGTTNDTVYQYTIPSTTVDITGRTSLHGSVGIDQDLSVKGNVDLDSGRLLVGGSVLSASATGGLGYNTGAGGTVTQATSRTTGVTINKICGAITLVSAAGSTTYQSFTVTNSTVAATDTIIVNQKSGTDLYETFVTAVAAGSFRITFATTGGTTTEQPVFNFSVIKAVTA